MLDPIAAANKDVAPKLSIEITDWTKSLGPALVDGHVTVDTTKSCTLDFALLD